MVSLLRTPHASPRLVCVASMRNICNGRAGSMEQGDLQRSL